MLPCQVTPSPRPAEVDVFGIIKEVTKESFIKLMKEIHCPAACPEFLQDENNQRKIKLRYDNQRDGALANYKLSTLRDCK